MPKDNNEDNNENNPENNPDNMPEKPPLNGEETVEAAARNAITKAGGNAELLLPHIKAKLGWRKDGDDMIVFSDKGEGDDGCDALVKSYRDNPNFSQAFTQNPDAPETPEMPETPEAPETQMPPKMGSGAAVSAAFIPNSIDGGDPLAIGYALKGIASGQMRIRFDG